MLQGGHGALLTPPWTRRPYSVRFTIVKNWRRFQLGLFSDVIGPVL
jgi:hypothetical protein